MINSTWVRNTENCKDYMNQLGLELLNLFLFFFLINTKKAETPLVHQFGFYTQQFSLRFHPFIYLFIYLFLFIYFFFFFCKKEN